MSKAIQQAIDLSIIITAHSESILTHRTLHSVKRAIKFINNTFSTEIILHVDNATPATEKYIKTHEHGFLKGVRLFQNSFGDLGSSRNFAIQQAGGKYIATIDADDLMSKNWLHDSLRFLESQTHQTIAHSEVTVEFEGADSLIIKHGEIDKATDTLLSVYANRWNSVIVAPRSLLVDEPYTPNSPGYGYEDWNLNCRFIAKEIHNILIPKTAIFVRRKKTNSEWARQIQSMSVLRANPALAFANIRSLDNPFTSQNTIDNSPVALSSSQLRILTKKIIKRNQLTHKIARKVKQTLKRQQVNILPQQTRVPDWLKAEWLELHAIDRQIFPSLNLMSSIPVYDTLTHEHKLAGNIYKQLIDSLKYDTYNYVIFVPWLVKGGADQYAINYANAIAHARPDKRVLVVGTLPILSPWVEKLSSNVDFLDFGNIANDASVDIKHRLMEHLIENAATTHIHIINSEFGYDFVLLHEKYIQATNKKVILTSFSQSVDTSGRIFGYSHTHVPFIYDIASLITSDNEAVIRMWQQDYGFDMSKMAVHRQAIQATRPSGDLSDKEVLRVLWAARIAPEKQPHIIGQIAEIAGDSIQIDVYGTIDPELTQVIKKFPENVTYKGPFDGFSTIPTQDYDALLYTSLFDGMPNTVLEAAQAGLPIVASAVGGIPEFIKDELTGMLIGDIHDSSSYSKALIKLKSGNVRAKLSRGAYDLLTEEFSPASYKQSVESMLKQVKY